MRISDWSSDVCSSDLLGLDEAALARHIAWDIGIAEVTRHLARRLDAPAVLSRFSRLIVDPNRQLDNPTLIPEISDGTVVPGNPHLDAGPRRSRVDSFFRPYPPTHAPPPPSNPAPR